MIRRDAKVRRYAQARKVVYYAERLSASKYEDQSVPATSSTSSRTLATNPYMA